MIDTKKPMLSFCGLTLLISRHHSVGYFSPTNRFTSLTAATVEHARLEAVYIFFDTATYNEIERDVKVKKDTVPAWINISQHIGSMTKAKVYSCR